MRLPFFVFVRLYSRPNYSFVCQLPEETSNVAAHLPLPNHIFSASAGTATGQRSGGTVG
jgi:hypothetical protein